MYIRDTIAHISPMCLMGMYMMTSGSLQQKIYKFATCDCVAPRCLQLSNHICHCLLRKIIRQKKMLAMLVHNNISVNTQIIAPTATQPNPTRYHHSSPALSKVSKMLYTVLCVSGRVCWLKRR